MPSSLEVKGLVERRLSQLHSLKSHRFNKFWEYRNEYRQWDVGKAKEDGYADYSMNTAFALVNSKCADILQSSPKYDFVALDDEGRKYKKVRSLFWDYVWMTSATDREIYKIVMDAMKYWVGFGMEHVVRETRKVKVPIKTGDEITFEEKEIIDYEGCRLDHISWDRVYLNGSSIENTSEAIVLEYYDRDGFMKIFSSSSLYSGVTEENIPRGKYYYVNVGESELTIQGNPGSTDRKDGSVQDDDTVSVLRYWNKYQDKYVVLANGKWINPVKGEYMPIISPSKEIPLLVFTDHYLEDDIYALGEFDITAKSRKLKDAARSLAIEVVKAQGWIITIDPDSEFDDAVMELGIRKYARVEKDAFGFFAPNINASTIQYIEAKADEDIIVESWVDFRSQISGAAETATSTEGKIQSQKKRIAQMMKFNAYSFYERLARLRQANMDFFYKDSPRTVPVSGMEVSDNWDVSNVSGGYGLFTMKPEYFGGKISLLPRVDSMSGVTSEETKGKFLQVLQLLVPLVDRDTGKPLFDPRVLVEAGRGIIDDVIDLDKINEKRDTSKTPEQILKEAGGLEDPTQMMSGDLSAQGQDSGFVPPEQRSGKAVLLPSQSTS